ncbi:MULTISPECIES: AEC family transporter [Shimia]|uniref:AEC family transporter n=1 Tax=Shimia TaxID=573139 RepID=UPI001FB29E77|nr:MULTISPECIES: AEC family transporter [Shimia]MDV4146077.1 AEC family transporter [Shimia sp. FJ5]
MQTLISVILPVFLVIGFGYGAAWRGLFSEANVDGLMRFATNFAVPVLLFRAIAGLDLSAEFDLALLGSFYTGAFLCFVAGLFGAHYFFGRDWEDAVAIGFVCLFSNSLLLGLPITERAFGADAMAGNYAIIAIHSPFCYGLGITVMEILRARGKSPALILPTVLKAMFSNALIVGISLGFLVNLSGTTLPEPVSVAVDLMARAALPAALFGMGGVLYRYRPEGDLRTIAYCCVISLVLHPAIVWALGTWNGLDIASFRSAVLTAAMPTGINGYLFASLYGRAQRTAASAVLIGTASAIVTIWLWLFTLP